MAIWSKSSKSSKKNRRQEMQAASRHVGGMSDSARYVERRNGAEVPVDTADMTVGDLMTGMPTVRLSSLLRGLMRQLPWVLILAALGSYALFEATKGIKRTYTGDGRLLVQIGPEYIYTPIGTNTNNNAGGISQTPDTIALNEVGIMKNSEIIDQVIGIMTSPRDNLTEEQAQNKFDKKGFEEIRKAERTGDKRKIEDAHAEMHESVSNSYMVAPRPKSSLIDVAFKHEDPDIAVETVNQFIDAYKNYRRTVFVEGTEDTISERRDETEKQLKTNERSIARFLERNDISDFESEQTGLRDRSETLKTELNTLRALMSETEASLATVEDQLRGTNPEINLYVDDRASQRIAQAELELKQLLARYLPTSTPVAQKRVEIAELRSILTANNGQAAGGRRVGPNPVHQALVTRRNTLSASADSYREREFVLQRQLDSAVAKVRRLTQLSPEYQNLLRERTTLSAALDTYNARAQEAAVNLAQAEANNENIKVISYATFAIKGPNTGKLIWAGGSLAWLLTLLMLALLVVFLNPKNFKAPDTGRSGPRRRRRSDADDSSHIPEPINPYEPRTPLPMTGQAAGQRVGQAAGQASGYPMEYQAAEYQQAGYAPAGAMNGPYGTPPTYAGQDPYAAQPAVTNHMAPEPGNSVQNPLYATGMPYNPLANIENNPYLQAQGQNNQANQMQQYGAHVNAAPLELPVLGSFTGKQA